MPVAVVVENNERCELKSLPGGYVIIRRMNYGESLQRKDMMANIAMEMKSNSKENARIEMALMQEKTSLWEFANLIIEHNLTDKNDRPLNFKDVGDVKKLQGKIGDEIQLYINNLNSFEEDEEIKN